MIRSFYPTTLPLPHTPSACPSALLVDRCGTDTGFPPSYLRALKVPRLGGVYPCGAWLVTPLPSLGLWNLSCVREGPPPPPADPHARRALAPATA